MRGRLDISSRMRIDCAVEYAPASWEIQCEIQSHWPVKRSPAPFANSIKAPNNEPASKLCVEWPVAMEQDKLEQLAQRIYDEAHALCELPAMGEVVNRMTILYGPPRIHPDLALVSFQGGAEDPWPSPKTCRNGYSTWTILTSSAVFAALFRASRLVGHTRIEHCCTGRGVSRSAGARCPEMDGQDRASRRVAEVFVTLGTAAIAGHAAQGSSRIRQIRQ